MDEFKNGYWKRRMPSGTVTVSAVPRVTGSWTTSFIGVSATSSCMAHRPASCARHHGMAPTGSTALVVMLGLRHGSANLGCRHARPRRTRRMAL